MIRTYEHKGYTLSWANDGIRDIGGYSIVKGVNIYELGTTTAEPITEEQARMMIERVDARTEGNNG